eukprot:6182945-Pleurochrysis_carterae.AAC.3
MAKMTWLASLVRARKCSLSSFLDATRAPRVPTSSACSWAQDLRVSQLDQALPISITRELPRQALFVPRRHQHLWVHRSRCPGPCAVLYQALCCATGPCAVQSFSAVRSNHDPINAPLCFEERLPLPVQITCGRLQNTRFVAIVLRRREVQQLISSLIEPQVLSTALLKIAHCASGVGRRSATVISSRSACTGQRASSVQCVTVCA